MKRCSQAGKKVKYWQKKTFESRQLVKPAPKDHEDMTTILGQLEEDNSVDIFPTPEDAELWEIQKQLVVDNEKPRRWHPR